MDLERYLARVGHRGPLEPSVETLTALHRAHLLAISYENLDIHLGRRLALEPESIFRKLVERGRGGWCYEMNGLFASVLERLGFRVQLMAGTVGRERPAPPIEGNHLVLIVSLDRPYLVDVGFGDGCLEPLPLEEGSYRRGGFEFGLVREGPRWRFRNHPAGAAPSFDFTLEPRTLGAFAEQCHRLQTDPDSGFVQTTVCQRHTGTGILTLRGAVLREITPEATIDRDLVDRDQYETALRERFGISLGADDVDRLWTKVEARHQAWVAGGRSQARS